MNVLKKVFCRAFQLVFRAALPFLPYREPQIFRAVDGLVPLFRERGIDTVLLVTDKQLRKMGITAGLERVLFENGITCVVYDSTCTNPTVDNVEEARTLYLESGAKCLIAFGGGSPIDCAKAVGARLAYPKRDLGRLKGVLRVLRRIPPLVAIPTTAGTGSEVTLAAVITDPRVKHKYTMNDFTLIPHFAVHDPAVTVFLPPHLTATTGMDALTHATEAFIGRSTTKETREKALAATTLIFANIERAYQNGQDLVARENMLSAAYLAGIAFSKSYVGYVHAVAHSLGGQYDVPHGLANSVLLPIVLRAYGKAVHKKLHRLGVAAGVASPTDSHATGAEKFIKAVEELNCRLGIPKGIKGIRSADIETMARHADKEANPLYPVPVLMDRKELEGFYLELQRRSEENDE